MFAKLKQLLMSSGSSGPKPSGLCLWYDLDGLNRLADELTEQAESIVDWNDLRRQLEESAKA